jgi:hypothetical protein
MRVVEAVGQHSTTEHTGTSTEHHATGHAHAATTAAPPAAGGLLIATVALRRVAALRGVALLGVTTVALLGRIAAVMGLGRVASVLRLRGVAAVLRLGRPVASAGTGAAGVAVVLLGRHGAAGALHLAHELAHEAAALLLLLGARWELVGEAVAAGAVLGWRGGGGDGDGAAGGR